LRFGEASLEGHGGVGSAAAVLRVALLLRFQVLLVLSHLPLVALLLLFQALLLTSSICISLNLLLVWDLSPFPSWLRVLEQVAKCQIAAVAFVVLPASP